VYIYVCVCVYIERDAIFLFYTASKRTHVEDGVHGVGSLHIIVSMYVCMYASVSIHLYRFLAIYIYKYISLYYI